MLSGRKGKATYAHHGRRCTAIRNWAASPAAATSPTPIASSSLVSAPRPRLPRPRQDPPP